MRRLSLAFLLGSAAVAATASSAPAAWQRSEFEITTERTDATTTFKQYEDAKKKQQEQQQQQQQQQATPSPPPPAPPPAEDKTPEK